MMSSIRINGLNTNRPSMTATSSEWATISSDSTSEPIDLNHLPANPTNTISTLSETSSTDTLRPRDQHDSAPRPFDAGVDRPRTFSLGAANALMNRNDDGNKNPGGRNPSGMKRHSIANHFFDSAGSKGRRLTNPFEGAPLAASDASGRSLSPPRNRYHAVQGRIRSPSPAMMSQHAENLRCENRRASQAPFYHRIQPSQAHRVGMGSRYGRSPPRSMESPAPRPSRFCGRRDSIDGILDDLEGHSSRFNDWVTWEQQRVAMARQSEKRNKRNAALAIFVSFVVLVACMVGFGFL